MKRNAIAKINHDFFHSDITLTLLNFNFTIAIAASLEKPVRINTYGKTKGSIIISNQIIKELEKKLFMEKVALGLISRVSEQIKHRIQGDLSNKVFIELDNFRFEFKIMKYEISSRPNLSCVTVKDLGEIYGNEEISPIVDLKITSVFDD
jgi:hypothetical protein